MNPNKVSYRILIIDDDEDDFFIIKEYIKNIPEYSFMIEWCFDYKQALNHIRNKEYDLYLVDYYLGAKTGLDFIKMAAQHGDEPIILLTGKGNHEIDIEAMQAGAIDYLIKSELNTEKLERTIRYSLQRSETMRALRVNENKYRHIFENSPSAIFLTDEQLAFLDANPATLELFELEKKQLINLSLFSFLSGTFDKKLFHEKLLSSDYIKEEVELTRNSGRIIYCLLSLSKEYDNNGHLYLQGILHDISDLKKEEKQKIHREKIDAAERISWTLAHEVRNPLTNISLATDQLTTEINSETAKVYIEMIKRNSVRIADLVTELLRPKPEIKLENNNLQQIMEESILAARDAVALKKIKLVTTFPTEIITIKADFDKLRIAFLNIIVNAVEAMQPEAGKLTIQVTNDLPKTLITIHDNGCGIKEENIQHLFEPYFTEKKNGLGLGLSTAYNTIMLHHGDIKVDSKVNEGTCFSITLPRE
jgi:PAS domain S-box-containing protein